MSMEFFFDGKNLFNVQTFYDIEDPGTNYRLWPPPIYFLTANLEKMFSDFFSSHSWIAFELFLPVFGTIFFVLLASLSLRSLFLLSLWLLSSLSPLPSPSRSSWSLLSLLVFVFPFLGATSSKDATEGMQRLKPSWKKEVLPFKAKSKYPSRFHLNSLFFRKCFRAYLCTRVLLSRPHIMVIQKIAKNCKKCNFWFLVSVAGSLVWRFINKKCTFFSRGRSSPWTLLFRSLTLDPWRKTIVLGPEMIVSSPEKNRRWKKRVHYGKLRHSFICFCLVSEILILFETLFGPFWIVFVFRCWGRRRDIVFVTSFRFILSFLWLRLFFVFIFPFSFSLVVALWQAKVQKAKKKSVDFWWRRFWHTEKKIWQWLIPQNRLCLLNFPTTCVGVRFLMWSLLLLLFLLLPIPHPLRHIVLLCLSHLFCAT